MRRTGLWWLAVGLLACGGGTRDDAFGRRPGPGARCRAGTADPDPVRPAAGRAGPTPFAFAPLQTALPVYRLEVSDAALAQVMADVSADVEVDGTFVAGEARYPAKVSLRGASSRYFPKRSWNVDLGTARLDGRGKLSLIAEYQDATLMAEKLAYDLLEAMGARASHASYVQLYLNGKYEGVFLDLERVDKALLKRTAVRGHRRHDLALRLAQLRAEAALVEGGVPGRLGAEDERALRPGLRRARPGALDDQPHPGSRAARRRSTRRSTPTS